MVLAERCALVGVSLKLKKPDVVAHPCNLSIFERLRQEDGHPASKRISSLKSKLKIGAAAVAQLIEHLPSVLQIPGSVPGTIQACHGAHGCRFKARKEGSPGRSEVWSSSATQQVPGQSGTRETLPID